MAWISTHIEFLPDGHENHIEVAVEAEYDFQPGEAAVMDVNSPMCGPGCDASAVLIEDSIRRSDGQPVCAALLGEVQAWWKSHGEAEAIEAGEERLAYRRAARRGRIPADPCD